MSPRAASSTDVVESELGDWPDASGAPLSWSSERKSPDEMKRRYQARNAGRLLEIFVGGGKRFGFCRGSGVIVVV